MVTPKFCTHNLDDRNVQPQKQFNFFLSFAQKTLTLKKTNPTSTAKLSHWEKIVHWLPFVFFLFCVRLIELD